MPQQYLVSVWTYFNRAHRIVGGLNTSKKHKFRYEKLQFEVRVRVPTDKDKCLSMGVATMAKPAQRANNEHSTWVTLSQELQRLQHYSVQWEARHCRRSLPWWWIVAFEDTASYMIVKTEHRGHSSRSSSASASTSTSSTGRASNGRSNTWRIPG